ncbi:heat-inducible transcription repressor HrcA [Companilactobacillus sp. RD055328]|uniref:heat-inducible transcriptional repressor HrcA n=1 Tax=Companilactobacillus sp. RD055328 TaxID=2916634 RepID=UPI001FC85287|nr:heat-inducible transcriptional repressor HrcA [Companilactobacillus sp. RD055328]GKQ42620.1 heat-inducible transcription repressor HrcA [Companilactobacillus sp. RD055328]
MLTDRQNLILKEIFRIFTETSQPVGSKTLMESLPISVSSATIRNEMAVLEEVGLIEKTHLSSGRVPSVEGYRYYLDYLVQPTRVSNHTSKVIEQSFNHHYHQIDDIIQQSAEILSGLTSYTAITLSPENATTYLTGFRIVPLSSQRFMAILVTNQGTVQSQVYTIPDGVSPDIIEKIVNIMNDELVGLPLNTVVQKLHTDIPALLSRYMHSTDGFLELFDDVFKNAARNRYFVDGQLNLLNYADPNDLKQIKNLYSTIDQNDGLLSLLGDQIGDQNINVKLGSEIGNEAFKNYSIITAKYNAGKHGEGLIALLGPTSMPYSKMIGLLGLFREELANKLIDYYNDINDD